MKHPASIAHRAPAAGRACSPTKAHRSGGRVGSLKHAAQKKIGNPVALWLSAGGEFL